MKTLIVLIVLATGSALWAQPSTAKKTEPPKNQPAAANSAELLAKLKENINGSPEQLAKEAQRLVYEVQAELEYGKPIATLETHIRLIEDYRIAIGKRADDAAKERKEMARELTEEIERVKKQYNDSPETADSMQVNLIVAFRAPLRMLKEEEDNCRRQVADADRQLLTLRVKKATFVEKRKLGAKGILADRELAAPVLPALELSAAGAAATAPDAPKETLKEALESIKELTK
jgi:predicted HTH domain antitoxin